MRPFGPFRLDPARSAELLEVQRLLQQIERRMRDGNADGCEDALNRVNDLLDGGRGAPDSGIRQSRTSRRPSNAPGEPFASSSNAKGAAPIHVPMRIRCPNCGTELKVTMQPSGKDSSD